MPLFQPVTTAPPPPRGLVTILPLYWRIAGDISRFDGRSVFMIMARILYARFRYGFGAEHYRLYRFNRKPLSSYHDYLPMEERDLLFRRTCPIEHRNLVNNKALFYERCVRHNLSTPRVFGLILKGHGVDNPARSISAAANSDELAHMLNRLEDGTYVLKPIDGGHGWGVTLIRLSQGQVTTHDGERLTANDVFRICAEQHYTNLGFLVQEYLTSHRDLLSIMPGPGLGSFRVVTFLWPDNSVFVYYIEVKIPGEGRIISNFSGGEGGSFLCRVDIDSGRIIEAVGATSEVPITTVIERHPSTGVKLSGMQMPMWPEAMNLIQRAAKAFPEFKTLGWDMALSDAGPTLMETNYGYGHDSLEITLNRGIRKEFRDLINRTLGEK